MDTYYQYRRIKIMIAHKLMELDGWKVYGYSPDQSDSMIDYYDPASWSGIAEKNGYLLCVNTPFEEKERVYSYSNSTSDNKGLLEKISKLEKVTVARGASVAEEETAKKSIERLQAKIEEHQSKNLVVDRTPGHMANPPKMNWHIEKNGVVIAKGNGILKFSSIWSYYYYRHNGALDNVNKYKADKEKYKEDYIQDYMWKHSNNREYAEESWEYHVKQLEKDIVLIDKFEQFINKLDTTCGNLLGDGDGSFYEKVTVTEYKTENKVVEDSSGSIKEGQLFVLNTSFTCGCYKGLVYRIHGNEYNDKKLYHAFKLNGKLTKECTGMASRNNYWHIGTSDDTKFLQWIASGKIAWCHIEEVKTPYKVEKVVKRTIKAEKKQDSTPSGNKASYTYNVSEDVDTRDNSKIYLVKVAERLSKEEYKELNKYIRSLGGYYSKFKHAFLFRVDPSEKLGIGKSALENLVSA